jgi:hypothetical protein
MDFFDYAHYALRVHFYGLDSRHTCIEDIDFIEIELGGGKEALPQYVVDKRILMSWL